MFYLYNNSQAQAKQGFFVNQKNYKKQRTTIEFAFAKEFQTIEAAQGFIDKHELAAIIFERIH